MKKSNWIILAVAVVISAFLLWLWYFLTFNRIDSPLDLVLSVVWWVIVAISIFAIWKVEQARRRRIRTIYVGERTIFNAEAGMKPYHDRIGLIEESERVLNGLEYNFDREELPDEKNDNFKIDFIIRTDEYKSTSDGTDTQTQAANGADAATTIAATAPDATTIPASTEDERTWKGEVVFAQTKEERPFTTKVELVRILSAV